MVSRYDAILAAIPASLLGGAIGEWLLAGAASAVPFILGLVVALVLVGRALFAGPVDES